MKIAAYILILAALYFAPVKRLDVADLNPVMAVAIYMEDGKVVLETDTEDLGRGATVEQALEAMKASTPRMIYLDTAQYLLVAENAHQQAEELRKYLKPSVRVGDYRGGQIKEEAAYLDVHGKLPKLKNWNG